MPRKQGKSPVTRAGGAIEGTGQKLTTKRKPRKSADTSEASAAMEARPKATPRTARTRRRESDVPLDLIAETYAPKQTSIKTSLRSDGADHEKDQELPPGPGETFENEDHFTNKSGDARIGTHGRTFARAGSARTPDKTGDSDMDTPMGHGNAGSGSTPTSSGGTGSLAPASSGYCPTCGQSRAASTNSGLEEFLGRLGITDEMITNLKSSIKNVDVEEYLSTAREYLKGGGEKATTYVKENPGKVAAGVAVLAVGTGLLISALNRD